MQVSVADRVPALAGLLKEAMLASRNAAHAPLAVRATALATACLQVCGICQHPEKAPIVTTGLLYHILVKTPLLLKVPARSVRMLVG